MDIKVEKSLGLKLQELRCRIIESNPKKSGYNGFGKYKYFQLEDFLPLANKIMNDLGMWSRFSIEYRGEVEYAILTFCDGTTEIPFPLPTAEPNASSNPIQNQGSKNTYMKRYCWMNALELTEDDTVEAVAGSEADKKINYATKFQVDKLNQSKELLIEEFKTMGVKSVNDIKRLTVEQASELVEKLEEKLRHAA